MEFKEQLDRAAEVVNQVRRDVPSTDNEDKFVDPKAASNITKRVWGFDLADLQETMENFSGNYIADTILDQTRTKISPRGTLTSLTVIAFMLGMAWQREFGKTDGE